MRSRECQLETCKGDGLAIGKSETRLPDRDNAVGIIRGCQLFTVHSVLVTSPSAATLTLGEYTAKGSVYTVLQ